MFSARMIATSKSKTLLLAGLSCSKSLAEPVDFEEKGNAKARGSSVFPCFSSWKSTGFASDFQ
jgi:hypothetical protein